MPQSQPTSQISRTPPPRELTRDDAIDDSVDVPAAIICALCGEADCTGCEREQSRSGIVALVAWERPGMPLFSRLWSTARAATITGDAFFELLPDGPIAPAFRFALTIELIAACGFVASTLPFAFVLAPSWVKHVLVDGGARDIAIRLGVVGIPSLALLLVAAHAAHGLALNRGARKVSGRTARSRALRFGLYATGWDLVVGPMGVVLLAFKEGPAAALGIFGLGVGLPGRCTRAFLRGCYGLNGQRADEANRSATVAAVIATFVGAVAILVGAVALFLATD